MISWVGVWAPGALADLFAFGQLLLLEIDAFIHRRVFLAQSSGCIDSLLKCSTGRIIFLR